MLTPADMINSSGQNPDVEPASYESDSAHHAHGRCLKVGVLTNPRSGGNKKGLKDILDVLAKWPETLHLEAFTLEGMTEALSEFSRKEVDLVVVNGGDGTVQAVLTVIGRAEVFARPPLLALLCAGTTSMLPRDVGIAGSPVAALSQILQWAKSTDTSLTVLPRPVLRVQRTSHQQPLFGMFFGAGAICQGIKVFHSGVNPMGWRGELLPGLTLLRMLLAILCKDHARVPPFLTKTCLDGRLQEEKSNLFVLITTLDRLFLGMRPYWGTEDGPLRYTAVSAEAKRLLRVLPSFFCWKGFRWQKNRHATAENGYSSHNVHEVQLEMGDDFTLDGELYDTGEGPVTIGSAGPVMFLCLN